MAPTTDLLRAVKLAKPGRITSFVLFVLAALESNSSC
jgi:hypothetical protein